ncbi:MAG: hypothetical protein ACREQZ_08245 [Woeseiaceae bacterium]
MSNFTNLSPRRAAAGGKWLSRGIPIEIDEVERMMAEPGALDAFVDPR